jgi:hypothetical protein
MAVLLRAVVATILALAVFAMTAEARADDARAPAYTLDVDSDASDVIAFDAIAARLASDLGGNVVRAGAAPATRAAITIQYRDEPRELHVRVTHTGGQTLERDVHAEGDAAAIQREAILLAANLARDEARELLDALAKKPQPPTPASPVAVVAPETVAPTPAPSPDNEERVPVVLALMHPLATNWDRPKAGTSFAVVMFYGQAGRIDVLGFGLGVVHATRSQRGAMLAGGATISGGDASGFQGAAGANITVGHVTGMQGSSGFNLATKGLHGAQLTAGANVAGGEMIGVQGAVVNIGETVSGAQLGVVNIARRVKGAQIGIVNIAEDVDGASIGMVSIARDIIHPVTWTSNLAYTNAGIKFATKYVYTITAIGFGTNETKLRLDRPAFTIALGTHLPIVRGLDVDLETAYSDVDLESPSDANRALHTRALPGWSFAKHLRVFAGGGIRIPVAFDRGSMAVRPEGVVGIQF